MIQRFRNYRRPATRIVCLLAGVCILTVGCAKRNWNLMGDGFGGPDADLGRTLRSDEKPSGSAMGLSSKAREIERDLGYR
jgi:hypothetical protein